MLKKKTCREIDRARSKDGLCEQTLFTYPFSLHISRSGSLLVFESISKSHQLKQRAWIRVVRWGIVSIFQSDDDVKMDLESTNRHKMLSDALFIDTTSILN